MNKRKEISDDSLKDAKAFKYSFIRIPLELKVTNNNDDYNVVIGVSRKDDFNNWIYNISNPIHINNPVIIKCDFNEIQYLKLDKMPCQKLICTGVFNLAIGHYKNIISVLKFDFSNLIVIKSVEWDFIKFLVSHIDIKSLHYISLPTLTDGSFLQVIEWIKSADNIVGFDYKPNKNNDMQSCVVDLIQKNIELKCRISMTPIYSPTLNMFVDPIKLKTISRSIITYHADQNMFDISRNLKYNIIELQMDQMKLIKYPLTEIKEFRFVGPYHQIDIDIKIDTANFSNLQLPNEKLVEFTSFLSKQKIHHLILPKIDTIEQKEIYENLMKIQELISVRMHESNSKNLIDFEDILNAEICKRNYKSVLKSINKS